MCVCRCGRGAAHLVDLTRCAAARAQPHFDDVKERTIEAYLCHDFEGRDFYAAEMRLLICAFLRPQAKFESFEALVEAISTDVDFGKAALDQPELSVLRDDAFFSVELEPRALGSVEGASAQPPPPATNATDV
jgi:hypothetical protein